MCGKLAFVMSTAETSETKPLGVIDALRQGFTLINRHPWLLLLPILVDFILWRLPRLSLAPLVEQFLAMLTSQPGLPADATTNLASVSEGVRALGQGFNVLGLLASTLIGFPSLLGRVDSTMVAGTSAQVVPLPDVQQLTLAIAIIIPVGLLIGSVWLAFIARRVDTDLSNFLLTLRRAGWIWLNVSLFLVGTVAALLAAVFAFSMATGMVVLAAGTGSLGLLNILLLMFFWFVLWLAIGLSFVVAAVALDGVNVARATWRSLNVVGRNLSSTVGLLLVEFIIVQGFVRIWLLLIDRSWGVPIAIFGNAYLGAALVAASLHFYRARYQHWQRVRSAMASARRQGGAVALDAATSAVPEPNAESTEEERGPRTADSEQKH